MSNLNVCPLVWHFCGEVNTKKVEKIQEKALRFIYEDYSITYEELLCKSKMVVHT
jgi:predicted nuclease of predicted toxin-antitoxin system